MKNILIILCLSSIALTSCESFFSQTVEIDPPPYEKQLSFHLNLSDQDTVAEVILTRNFGILEYVPSQNQYLVYGGSVELLKNGQPWLALQPVSTDSSFLLSGTLPEPFQIGQTYTVRATHPDFPLVEATQVVPGDFQLDSAKVKREAISGPFGDVYDLIDVYIQDAPGVRNYYEVKIFTLLFNIGEDPVTGEPDTIFFDSYNLYPEDFSDPSVLNGIQGGALFSDQFFEGKTYKFQAQVYANSNPYLIQVRNITEDYYKWSRSYLEKLNSEENFLVEPISVFNNLKDGLGIFTLAREKRIVIE
jgi:hypothetical protein